MEQKTCCFIGHRRIENHSEVQAKLQSILTELIEQGVTKFIFGDHSQFNDLCYDVVSELKKNNTDIQRIKFRKDYQKISDSVKKYFLDGFEDNICPDGVAKAGKASYVKRNQAMITASNVCIFYYNENYQPERRKESKHSIGTYQPKSGTRLAYEFAASKDKEIINLYE